MTKENKNNKTQLITSKDNPLFKKLKLILSAKGIKEHNLFFLMGDKLIKEFLKTKNKKFKIHLVIVTEKYFAKFPFTTLMLSQDLFNELDTLGTHYPLFVLECENFETVDLNTSAKGIEVILPLGDPRNLGALVRSAVGFGLQNIILTTEACHPYLPQSVKASAGAILNINFKQIPCSIHQIPVIGDNYALDLKGEEIHTIKWPNSFRLWIGEEGPGLNLNIDQQKKIKKITIPTQHIESLNASVSAGISFWEIKKSISIK